MKKIIALSVLAASALVAAPAAEVMSVKDVESAYTSKSIASKASKELTQSINLGFANTAGVTETTTVSGKYTAGFATNGYNNQELRVAFDAAAYYNKVEGSDATAEYSANLGAEQEVFNGWFGYGMVNWVRNEELGYKNKVSLGLGLGKVVYKDAVSSLKIKLGAAFNMAEFNLDESINALIDDNYWTVNEYIEYNRALSAHSNFYAKIGASENVDEIKDLEGDAVLGLSYAIAPSLSLSVEEEIHFNSLTAFFGKGRHLLDRRTASKTVVRVGYNF